MTESAEILVVINSVVLIVFLLIGLVLLIQILLLVRRIKKFIEKAEAVADNIGIVSNAVKQATFGVGFGKVVKSVFNAFSQQSKESKKHGKARK